MMAVATALEGPGGIREVAIGVAGKVLSERLRESAEGGWGLCGPDQQLMLASAIGKLELGRLFDDDVGIGPADSKGAHAGAQRSSVGLPRLKLATDIERAVRQIEVRVGLFEMKQSGDGAIFDLKNRFDEADATRSYVEMADIRLGRAERAEARF